MKKLAKVFFTMSNCDINTAYTLHKKPGWASKGHGAFKETIK
jgi:hypothetical protein